VLELALHKAADSLEIFFAAPLYPFTMSSLPKGGNSFDWNVRFSDEIPHSVRNDQQKLLELALHKHSNSFKKFSAAPINAPYAVIPTEGRDLISDK
jgi:hypothetical protein